MADLNLSNADRIADICLTLGRERGYAPLTVVVLYPGGHIIVSKRSDGSGIVRHEIAFGKAWGALGMGLPSRVLAERASKMEAFFTALSSVSGGRMVPVPGGVLVRSGDGAIVGAVGVSGDTSDHDEDCAVAAIEEVGLIADVGAASATSSATSE